MAGRRPTGFGGASRPASARYRGRGWIGAIGLVVLLGASGTVAALPAGAPISTPGRGLSTSAVEPSAPPATPWLGVPATVTPINTSLSINATASNLSSNFWGVTINNEVHLLRGTGDDVNATPARVLVWPGAQAGDDYDPFTQTHWDQGSGIGTHALTTEAQFVQMCEAIHCTAIVQVPAEIDNPQIAEAIVNYTEVNLSFHPAFWMIGNEPELWGHWKVPWNEWANDYTEGPDPTQFGQEVVTYVNAIRQVDNTTPILGLPASGCTCGSWTFEQWISGVLKVTGNKIQAVAFHEYPAGWLGTGTGSLEDFYDTIQSPASIPPRIAGARAAVTSSCPGCNVSVFISELGAALSWSEYGQYSDTFAGSLSIAAQLTQAMTLNVTNVDLFAAQLNTTNSWYSAQGHVRPDYGLYTEILDHLGTESFPVNASGPGHTVYSIATIAPNDAGRRDLFVVNVNITHSVEFTPKFAQYDGDGPVAAYYWNGSIHASHGNGTTWVEPYTPDAVPLEYSDGLPSTFVLPPQSLVVFETYPGGGTFVTLNQTGVPAGTPWYASVGDAFYSTTAANLTVLRAPGTYRVGGAAIPLPLGGREFHPTERLAPFAASPTAIAGSSQDLTVTYVPQWRVNVTTDVGGGGNVSAPPTFDGIPGNVSGWWNDSQPLTLTAEPSKGYAFDRWSGFGPGSFNGSGRTIRVVPSGPVHEKAIFVPGQEVDLMESGLPAGTPWSVTVHGFVTNSTTDLVTTWEPVGTYGYQLSPIDGYRALPLNGSFTVASWWTVVEVQYVPITPPPPSYGVEFETSGLPAGTAVPITVRGSLILAASTAVEPAFQLSDGFYGYQVGYIAGYHADVSDKTFVIADGPTTVVIPFVPTVYSATWSVIGARRGMDWTIALNGTAIPTGSAWVSTDLRNGTYPFTVQVPSNYSAEPRSGVLHIVGGAARLTVLLHPQFYSASFQAEGLVAGPPWSVRLGNFSVSATSPGPTFVAPNGTYTFDVHPPAGYYAVPSHGNLTVAGDGAPVMIAFHPVSQAPSAALVAALSSVAFSVSIWMGASVLLGYAAVRTVRRRGG